MKTATTVELKKPTPSSATAGSAALRIEGPTQSGGFFIHDGKNVWDGKAWRGFGAAAEYKTFSDAIKATKQIKPPNADLRQDADSAASNAK